jgi:hypothetical protein
VKFIVLDLTTGKIRNTPVVYLSTYLEDHGCTQVLEKPDNEFYLIIGCIQLMRWYNNSHTYKDIEIINDVKNNKAGLILTTNVDSFGLLPVVHRERDPGGYYNNITKYNIVENVNIGCDSLGIDSKSVIYIDTNYKIHDLFKKHGLSAFWNNIFEKLMPPIDLNTIIQDIKNKKDREKKFLYLGGKGRIHRLPFVNELLKIPDFKNDSFLSTGGGNFIDFFTKEQKCIDDIVLDIEDIRDIPENLCLANNNYHVKSYVNIIPMSYFYLDHTHLEINEKLFKPIINFQPFLILGQIGTLRVMHQLGYKTFDNWIDESYDTTMNDDERFIKVLNEVKRISKMSTIELNDMLLDMLPTLEYNANLHRTRYLQKDYSILDRILNKFNQSR